MGKQEKKKCNIQTNEPLDAHLYATTYEELSLLIEDSLLHAYLNTKQEGMKRAVVRAVASSILIVDIAKIAGVGGEAEGGRVGENGCLPHSNFPKKMERRTGYHDTEEWKDFIRECPEYDDRVPNPPKISKKNYEQIGRRICGMLESLASVELTDEEWEDSYRLYVKRRNKKRRESTQPKKC